MKYDELYKNLRALTVFSTQDVLLWEKDFRLANLDRWQNEGKISQLRRGWYIFTDTDYNEKTQWLIANRIYSPSYVSLESALSYYGVIPESVKQVTSVTTNKTATFENKLGGFQYYSIKEELNFGYTLLKHEDQNVKIAYLEKAILDLFYLRPDIKTILDIEAMRLNTPLLVESLDQNRLNQYSSVMNSPKLNKLVIALKRYLNA